ncbi:MAG TPA: SURF1 family protein [Candidatus Nanopelagicaceae bacterium]
MNRSNLQRSLSYFSVVVIATSFVGLGIWQWDRAQQSRIPVKVDGTLIPLQSISQPRIALPGTAALRRVSVSGKYILDFKAPNQQDGQGRSSAWQVGLLDTDSGGAILVVRGLWSQHSDNPAHVVVTGRLMPHQSDDHAEISSGVLARLDSSLVVNQTSLDLYDGYVIADGESGISRARISPPTAKSAVPGFYWQHLSYVIIWWFMAGVVLFLPFYQRRVSPNIERQESEL